MNLILTFQVRAREVLAEVRREYEARSEACRKERDDI